MCRDPVSRTGCRLERCALAVRSDVGCVVAGDGGRDVRCSIRAGIPVRPADLRSWGHSWRSRPRFMAQEVVQIAVLWWSRLRSGQV